jgi:hypothetical protein
MQRKLTLDPDSLRVASFEAGPALVAARGTVEGREGKIPCPTYITSCPATYHTCASFDRSCIEG